MHEENDLLSSDTSIVNDVMLNEVHTSTGSGNESLSNDSINYSSDENSKDDLENNSEIISGEVFASAGGLNLSFSDSDMSRIKVAWDFALSLISQEINSQVFIAYFKPLKFGHLDQASSTFFIISPSRLISSYIVENFLTRISGSFINCLSELFEAAYVDYFKTCRFDFITAAVADPVFNKAEAQFFPTDVPINHSGNYSGEAGRIQAGKEEAAEDLTVNIYKSIAPQKYIVVKKFSDKPAVDAAAPSAGLTAEIDSQPADCGSNLNPKYTFDSYVVGTNNQFCHAAALRVAEQPGKSYNPLFVYGGVGLGKTHLLHAIGNAVLQKDPTAKVLYMSSEAFTNELIQALRHAKMDEFKKKLRSIQVLLIDDIQFISGKERTQEEFFHTFNSLYAAKNQIIITSDRLPSDIPGIEERLQTRFSWGLTADLQAPDFETRVAILRRKAALDNFDLPQDVSHFIAENISSNVRELEGALTRLNALVSLQNIPLNRETAQSALKALIQPRKVQVSINDIKKAVATKFNVKVSEIVSKRRTKNLSFPRHIAMYLCRKHTTASYPDIGDEFGGRDHSSVIHAANVVSSKIKSDSDTKAIILEIEDILGVKKAS